MLQAAYATSKESTGRPKSGSAPTFAQRLGTESNRWSSLRNAFLELPQGVRFHLLAYPKTSKANVAVRVTDVRRQETDDGAEPSVSLKLSRAEGLEEKVTLPVQFEIEGARSVVPVEMSSPVTDLKDHQIPLERSHARGWGKFSIPADANPADDDYYFVFDRPPPRRAVLVCEDPRVERPLALATAIAPEPGLDCSGQTVDPSQLATVDWDQTALPIWQAPLPTDPVAATVQAFVDRGGQVVFFPPANPGNEELFGVRWTDWVTDPDHVPIETWRSDEDVLARTLNGAALPVGQLEVLRYCGLQGETTALATLRGGAPLSPGHRPSAAASTFGQRPRRRSIHRWLPAAWCCTRSCSGCSPPAPKCWPRCGSSTPVRPMAKPQPPGRASPTPTRDYRPRWFTIAAFIVLPTMTGSWPSIGPPPKTTPRYLPTNRSPSCFTV